MRYATKSNTTLSGDAQVGYTTLCHPPQISPDDLHVLEVPVVFIAISIEMVADTLRWNIRMFMNTKLGRGLTHPFAISWFQSWQYFVQVLDVMPCICPITSIRKRARATRPEQRWRGRNALKRVGPFFGTCHSASSCFVLICFRSRFRNACRRTMSAKHHGAFAPGLA